MRLEERAMLAMSAYDALLENFNCFKATWAETAGATPGARVTMKAPDAFTLFDGYDVDMVFSMVFDGDGTAWGKIIFRKADQNVWTLYIDPLGRISDKIDAREPVLCQTVSNHYRFSELLFLLVDHYLNLPHFTEPAEKIKRGCSDDR